MAVDNVNIPYEDWSILRDDHKRSFAWDVTRDCQHLPTNSDFLSMKMFDLSFNIPFLASGYDITTEHCEILGADQCRRFHCPAEEDDTHGVLTISHWAEEDEYRGHVRHRLNCTCYRNSRQHPIYSQMSSILRVHHESLELIAGKFVHSILRSTNNVALGYKIAEVVADREWMIRVNYHAAFADYDPLQFIELRVFRDRHNKYKLAQVKNLEERMLRKECAVCKRSPNADNELRDCLLLFQFVSKNTDETGRKKCRHHICELCNIAFWGRPRGTANPDYVGPPVTSVINCPTCGDILSHELMTPFDDCRTLRAPTPIFYFGQKAIYTTYTYRLVRRLFNLHFRWYLAAIELTEQNFQAVREQEFIVRAQLDRLRGGHMRPPHVIPVLLRLSKVVKAREAWENVKAFLLSKRVFLDWFYDFDTPLPEPILHDDAEYYERNMENMFYHQIRFHARDLQNNITFPNHIDL